MFLLPVKRDCISSKGNGLGQHQRKEKCPPLLIGASLVAQRVKHLTAMWETWVRSLGQEDPLEKEMATHSSTLAWKILWMEEPGTPWDRKELDTTEQLRSIHLGCSHVLAWRRQWHPTPILLPGKSHGWRSLVGCSPCGR